MRSSRVSEYDLSDEAYLLLVPTEAERLLALRPAPLDAAALLESAMILL